MSGAKPYRPVAQDVGLEVIRVPDTQSLQDKFAAWLMAEAHGYNQSGYPPLIGDDEHEWLIAGIHNGWFVLVEQPEERDTDMYWPRRWVFAGNEALTRQFDLGDSLPTLVIKGSRMVIDGQLAAALPSSFELQYQLAVYRLSGLIVSQYHPMPAE